MITGPPCSAGFALLIGVPIAIALGVATMLSMLTLNIPMAMVPQWIFTGLDSTAIMAIPFFVLAGNLTLSGGISRRLVAFVNSIVGKAQSGMAFAMVVGYGFLSPRSRARRSPPWWRAARCSTPRSSAWALSEGALGRSARGFGRARADHSPEHHRGGLRHHYHQLDRRHVHRRAGGGPVDRAGAVLALVCRLARAENWPKEIGSLDLGQFLRSSFHAPPAVFLPVLVLGGIYSGIQTLTKSAATAVVYLRLFRWCLPLKRDRLA